VTLQTIADRVGVSRMTVSNAFSRPDQLSATLRERILNAAQELGYAGPDPAARALARGTTGAVGVLLTESLGYAFSDEVATRFLGAIADGFAPTGLALTLLSTAGTDRVVPARDVAMDGALVYSCDPQADAVSWLMRRRLPLVFVDQAPARGIPSVNVEDRAGARAAARHLLDLGHRRVGILTAGLRGPHGVIEDPTTLPDGYPSQQRMRGWLDALESAGEQPLVVRLAHSDPGGSYEGARLLLDRSPRPSAVLCFSDTMAYGVYQAAEDLDIRVPAELSVVGFDDHPLAARMRPALTTVRQDVTAKGHAAAAALAVAIEASRAGSAPRVRHVMLPTEFVVRDSTAGPPDG
jgi:DNA-binding LacI/PurR family transcriptional regulator